MRDTQQSDELAEIKMNSSYSKPNKSLILCVSSECGCNTSDLPLNPPYTYIYIFICYITIRYINKVKPFYIFLSIYS